MFIRVKVTKGLTKKQISHLVSGAKIEGESKGWRDFTLDFERRIRLLELDGVENISVKALKTWWKQEKN